LSEITVKDSIVQADNALGKLKFTIVEIDQLLTELAQAEI